VLTPLIQQFLAEKKNSVFALPASCFIPIAPRFIHVYLQKLSGEKPSEKEKSACVSFVRMPFSKVSRETFGLHRKGGRLGEIFYDKKG